ncbi:hypothetical protein FOA52_013021 [Chlamydomonas sp. UWO 241]|nr:hypothetical protein FOA52_013021 [Chlamydomonas sp. UWO 241]
MGRPALESALESPLWPHCNSTYDGFCVDNWGGRGSVVYYDFEHCRASFINLPGINLLPNWLLGVMWGLFLIWTFFGIAIVSDAFVAGIEVITAKTHMVKRHDSKGNVVMRDEPVWNWAVANITLLAVGGSSPEILLSIVDTILTLGKTSGTIGAATIVGSAAYNLFVIAAVCTVSMQANEYRKIEHFKVFIWTTTWSMWAYLWLWIVYKRVSPNEVEIWEAWVTLAFMPVFVWTTYMVDTRGWMWFGGHKNSIVSVDEEGKSLDEESNDGDDTFKLPPGQVSKHSILYYRAMVVQNMGGLGHVPKLVQDPSRMTPDGRALSGRPSESGTINAQDVAAMGEHITKILMKSPEISVLESAGAAKISVMRMHGNLKDTLRVQYQTRDETAVSGLDYETAEGELIFGPGEDEKDIVVKILDDDMSEPDVMFSVNIVSAEIIQGDKSNEIRVLRKATMVTVVDDDDGGVVMFELPTWEAGVQDSFAQVVVIRRHGADGNISIDYATKDGSALAGKHFAATKGRLEFNTGDVRKIIQIPLLPVASEITPMTSPAFRVMLTNPMGGVVLGARKECRVVMVKGTRSLEEIDDGEFRLSAAWTDQFKDAVLPEFNEDEDNLWMSIILHYISITFKVIAACIPPADWADGYPCFIIALLVLGLLMAVVKEVAEMFGCAVGLSDLMTGMSIVALGTSLPDTFASRLAALGDDNADAAIGNIMGSNACNVFLGMGIPWVIGSAYYKSRDEVYVTEAGSLGFALMIFFILAIFGIAGLLVRRKFGGEIGGATATSQWSIFAGFVSLWLLFLLLTGLNDYGHIESVGL